MKILLLNYEYPPIGGGAANATYYILKEFSKIKGLYIDLVTSSVSDYKVENISNNIKIHCLNIGKKGSLHYQTNEDLIKYSIKAYRYCKKLIKNNKFDLIHAFFGIPCGFIAMKFNLPYIVSLRGSDVPFYNKRFELLDNLVFKRLNKKIWANAQEVIANSNGLKELALCTSPMQKIKVIYNGVDINKFKPPDKKRNNNELKIISTGRLIKRKGFEYLIEACEGLNEIKLQIIGDGILMDNLKKFASEKNVKVEFSGKINHKEIFKYLQNADIFVMSSLNEGMSNSLLEAMACGLPIISTDVGGSKELIKGNGFIVKKADSCEIRRCLIKYKSHKSLLKNQGIKSRKIAQSMSWNKVSNEYYGIYQKVLKHV